jgi:allophanate hydrolase
MKIRHDLGWLKEAYANGLSPVTVIEAIYDKIEETALNPIWISLQSREVALTRARELSQGDPGRYPLYGVPFAVKDNIDVAGLPTTAACPAYAYEPSKSAASVENLLSAGAIVIGKTNLDQFATGLVGVRSPYGACSSVFDDDYISGGSSSGSAVAVAKGLVSFALGTDTAGSGRVPAAFNNIVGLKPTKGLVSTLGVVPACRSLDCVSIFAQTVADAAVVLEHAAGFVEADPFSRHSISGASSWLGSEFRFGTLKYDQREFFGDDAAAALYENAIAQLSQLGGTPVPIDYEPFQIAAELLYSGPWVAERLAALGDFFDLNGPDMDPTVHKIIAGAKNRTAVDAYIGQYKLAELCRRTEAVWQTIDVMLLPTTGTIYKKSDVLAEPIKLNANLGRYTNFVNLLDLCALAIPAGFRPNGLPVGVTLVGRAFADTALLSIGDKLHRSLATQLGELATNITETPMIQDTLSPPGCTLIAVVGAHLTGQPLNHQLTGRGARLAFATRTNSQYKLYALPNTSPKKPGLVKTLGFGGNGIEVEIWAMPTTQFGSFVAEIPAPLGIGTITLSDGKTVKGFICEPSAVENAVDITHHGGWINYLNSMNATS